jgi:hypothetical protein
MLLVLLHLTKVRIDTNRADNLWYRFHVHTGKVCDDDDPHHHHQGEDAWRSYPSLVLSCWIFLSIIFKTVRKKRTVNFCQLTESFIPKG